MPSDFFFELLFLGYARRPVGHNVVFPLRHILMLEEYPFPEWRAVEIPFRLSPL